MQSANHNQPSIKYSFSKDDSFSQEDWTAFVKDFLTDVPDGYYVRPGPGEYQITVSSVDGGIRSSTILEKYGGKEYPPLIAGALRDMARKIDELLLFEQENIILREQLAIARKNQFGTSSEQQHSPEYPEQIEPAAPPKPQKLQVVRNAGRKPIPAHLPRDIVTYAIPEDERKCPCCGKPMRECGEDISEQVIAIPTHYRVNKRVRKKYVCRSCDKFVVAPAPKSMVPGSSYGSPEFLAHVAVSKYQHGLPFYRQQAIFEQSDLPFNRTTLANLMIGCTDQLTPLIQLLKDALLTQGVIHADETTIQVLKEEGRKPQTKSYLWLYRSAASAVHQVVLFDYQETRNGEHPRNFLKGFNHYLQVDGYSGYNNIPNVVRVACMAHIRRKFVDTADAIPAGHGEHSFAQQAIDMIGELYGIEQGLAGKPAKAVFDVRQRESIPIMYKFKKWLDDMKPKVTPKSLLGRAIYYAIEQWPAMLRYVDDGDLAIDNNISEREIKLVVIGRKNWLFADTPDGAYANATMYSLVQTAKANGLNPYEYLLHVFATLPNLKTAEEVKQLLPWNIRLDIAPKQLAA